MRYGPNKAHMPMFRYTFWPLLIHSWANWVEKFGNSGEYYLSIDMRNPSYDTYFSFFIFGPLLVGMWAWPPCAPLMVLGLQTRPKSWPTECYFWATLPHVLCPFARAPQPLS